MYRRSILILCILCALVGVVLGIYLLFSCRDHSMQSINNPVGIIKLTSEEMDIYETVLRYQILNSGAAGRGRAIAFVQIQEKNPAPEFLMRFRGELPRVEAGRRFIVGKGIMYIL